MRVAEEDVVQATLANDAPPLPGPPKKKPSKTVSWRELAGGLRPDHKAPLPPGAKDDGKAQQKKKATRKLSSGKLRAKREALQKKKKNLAKKWGKLAKKFSKRDVKAPTKQKAMCQLCSQQKVISPPFFFCFFCCPFPCFLLLLL